MVLIEEIEEDDAARCLRLKEEGNSAYKRKEYTRAREKYSAALQLADCAGSPKAPSLRKQPSLKAQLLSNRCQVFMCMGDCSAALEDATQCCSAAETWAKAHHRLGTVLAQMQQFREAHAAFERATKLEPADSSLRKACEDAYAALMEHGPPVEESDEPMGSAAGISVAEGMGIGVEPAAEVEAEAAAEASVAAGLSDAANAGTDAEPREPQYKLAVVASELVLTAALPLVASMKHLTVQISSRTFSLEVPQMYALTAELPKPIDDVKARARFDRKTRTFTLRAPLLVAGDSSAAAA